MKNRLLLISCLLIFPVIFVFAQQKTTNAADSEIVLNISVTDVKGTFITGLAKDNFTVNQGKDAAQISSFMIDEPAEVFFLLEKSNGMKNFYSKLGGGKQSFVYQLISRFMRSGNSNNSYSVFAFNKILEQLQISTRKQNDVLAAIAGIDTLKMDGPAAYIDACYAGIESLSRSDRKKRALVLFTQGNNSKSKYTSKQLQGALKENNILLYIVTVTDNLSLAELGTFVPNSPQRTGTIHGMLIPSEANLETMSKFDALIKLTTIAGGKSYFPRSAAETAEVVERISGELRSQYTLEIKSINNAGADKSQRLKVKIKPPPGTPSLYVRYREEFSND